MTTRSLPPIAGDESRILALVRQAGPSYLAAAPT